MPPGGQGVLQEMTNELRYDTGTIIIKENFAKFCAKEIEPRAQMLDKASHEEVDETDQREHQEAGGPGLPGHGP